MAKQDPAVFAGELLEEYARTRRPSEATITYGDLAERLGFEPFRGPDWNNHPLSRILGRLNDADHAAGRPFRTVLVVSSDTRYSGNSFFAVVEELRQGGTPIPAGQRYQYWCDELERLLRHHHNPHI